MIGQNARQGNAITGVIHCMADQKMAAGGTFDQNYRAVIGVNSIGVESQLVMNLPDEGQAQMTEAQRAQLAMAAQAASAQTFTVKAERTGDCDDGF